MIIIGAGRVGTALYARDPNALLVTRTTRFDTLKGHIGEPIVVAVRNDDLSAVLERVPAAQHRDMVFVQNGMIRPWLVRNAMTEVTRGLLFFAVPSRGAEVQPGASSPFCGPRAAAVVQWLLGMQIDAEVVSEDEFAAVELEKLIWNCAFGLLCEVYDVSVGEVVDAHLVELRDLATELCAVGSAALDVQLTIEDLVRRLCDYSRTISAYQGAVKEWTWRNGWFVEAAMRHQLDTPVHRRLLMEIGR